MEKEKSNYFVLNTFDEEENMNIQFHYWIEDDKYFSSTELENGITAWSGEITEEQFISALEELYNA